jgi:general secretion pathway protein G
MRVTKIGLSLTICAIWLALGFLATSCNMCTPHGTRWAAEGVLREDLLVLRSLIEQYKVDKHRMPESLEELVSSGYLKKIPDDPITHKPDWVVSRESASNPPNNRKLGITDVHSSSSTHACDGSAYSSW